MRTARRIALPALTLALAAIAATGAQAQVKSPQQLKYPQLRMFEIPQAERVVLDNGMVLILMEDHELPLISATARIRTGSRLEPAEKVGLTAVLGQTLRTGGTAKMNGDAVDDFLEARAAVIETGVAEDSASADMSCLSQDFPEVLKVYADILRTPAFAEDKIKIAKNAVTAGIARRNDNPQGVMFREFEKLIYGPTSPYARVAEYDTLGRVTRDDLVAFHKTYFQPNRIILGIVGDFKAQEMKTLVKAAFGDWPKGPAVSDPVAPYQTSSKPGIYYVDKEDMTQSDIIMGHLGIKKDSPDIFAVAVFNEALGGSQGARLFYNVRSKKGLAYAVRGLIDSSYDYPGTFNVWMTTKTETTAAGIDALLAEIEGVSKNPFTEAEVERAKQSILNSFVFNYDSREKILRQQITYEYFGFPADYLARYRENIDKVTLADVLRVGKNLVHRDQLAILVIGPSKGQDRPLSSFGPVSKVDITIPEPSSAEVPAATPESAARGVAIFAKVLDGLGGAKAVEGVKGFRSVFNSTRKTPQGEMNLKVVATVSLPDRVRQEMTTPMGQVTIVMAGNDGFIGPPSGGTVALPDSQRADITRSLRRQPISLAQHRNDPDFKVQGLGPDTVDGVNVEKLLVSIGEDETRLYVDPATGRILRQAHRSQGQQGPGELVITYSDFKEVAGLTLPYKQQTTFNGEPQETRVVEEITVNPTLDPSIFAKPAAAQGSN